jgi:transketolase
MNASGMAVKELEKIATTIRVLSMDAIQKANSGHPGLPMGCAEIGAYLYGEFLRHNPKNPFWMNRDRFILSAGHGCMLLYSCLHLAGFDLSLDEIKNFRQFGSKTPGHPEYLHTDGVETTSGPLGQGIANAVGQALGMKMLAQEFNTEEFTIIDNKIVCLAGDGCLMEGVTNEAVSFAGHLSLDNLILIYDSNDITLDGPLSDSCSEDFTKKFEACGWDVFCVDGHSFEELSEVFSGLRKSQTKPCMIIAKTEIGKGSPNKAGSHSSHGAPLGTDEVLLTKKAIGASLEEDFFVPQSTKTFFSAKSREGDSLEEQWNDTFKKWSMKFPDKASVYQSMLDKKIPQNLEKLLSGLSLKTPIAGRAASHSVINFLAEHLPFLCGGSADLSCSDKTTLNNFSSITKDDFSGRNIKFGVREFAMSAIASGMVQTQMFLPFVGTFLTFSDYMRNAIRLAALMKLKVIYQFTHDSVFLGEDGPTHQPVEHLASLRSIPGLQVIRPADDHEVKMAWVASLNYQGPTAIILSRQALPELLATRVPIEQGLGRGAYVVFGKDEKVDITLVASGSELNLAFDTAEELQKLDKKVKVISMPCWEIFEKQPVDYQKQIFNESNGLCVSIEAGIDQGWHKYIGSQGLAICMESFGASAPIGALAREFGFTVESILERILSHKEN